MCSTKRWSDAVAARLWARQPITSVGFRPCRDQQEIAWSETAGTYTRPMNHVGIGYDVHPFSEGRKLMLGGVEIPHAKGLDGHSDADVLLHAITDAVLGALGEADIGHFFPNTDARWKNVASKVFLQEAARQVAFREGRVVNVDATVIAQQPKIAPHIQALKIHSARALGVNLQRVAIKATTNEHLGFIGRGEGIAAMAVASVELPEAGSTVP